MISHTSRVAAGLVTIALVVSGGSAWAEPAAAKSPGIGKAPRVQKAVSVDGTDFKPRGRKDAAAATKRYRASTDLPGATVSRKVQAPERAGERVEVPGLPLSVGRVTAARGAASSDAALEVRSLAQSTARRASILGPVFEIKRAEPTQTSGPAQDAPTETPPAPTAAPSAQASKTAGASEAPQSSTASNPSAGATSTPTSGATVQRPSTPAQRVPITLDYSSFKDAFGGDWSSRLRLVLVPECRLTASPSDGCGQPVPLATKRQPGDRLTATAPMATDQQRVMVAATAAPSGSTGDFTATPLAASSAWSVGLQTGNFSWSYPMPTVPVASGLSPDLSVQYSSQSVDGRVQTSNNQTSWLGEGQNLSSGFIERGYAACADSQPTGQKTGDLCWKQDNASISFQGQSGKLVRIGSTDEYRLENDEGWRIRRLSDTSLGNGDDNGEYWLVTDQDGTRYYFGRNRRFGDDSAQTKSTWTVPVFGDDAGEPCYDSTFANAWCDQAWRWNLDYVVDLHGNSISYFYEQETNRYGLNKDSKQPTYVRGGYLDHIDYGQVAGKENAVPAAARVVFNTGERCMRTSDVNCRADELNATTAPQWPDVPFDQICTSSTSCGDDRISPTFFSRRRLESMTTQVLRSSGYDDVDTFTFDTSFPTPADATGRSLWLDSISRRGLDGGSIDSPAVQFGSKTLDNRVLTDGAEPLKKRRVESIRTETGGLIAVSYKAPDCTPTSVPSPSNNSRLCFPVYWSQTEGAAPSLNWFNKYVVASVTQSDLNGTIVPIKTSYSYLNGAGWHYDDNQLVRAKYRTYGEWRGFKAVEVRTGDPSEASTVQSYDKYTYFRGLDGDRLPDGSDADTLPDSRQESVAPEDGAAMDDLPAYRGFQREHIQRDGPGGSVISAEVDTPIASKTADNGEDEANLVRSSTTNTRKQNAAATAYIRSTIRRTFDAYGMQLTEQDNGDDAITGDTTCTRTEYVRNEDIWLLSPVKRQQEATGLCSSTMLAETSTAILSDLRYQYDGLELGATPTKGDQTVEQTLSGSSAQGAWKTTGTTDYDARGRMVASTDGRGNKSTVSFTPSGEGTDLGPVIQQRSTNAKGQSTTTTYSTGRGLPTRVTAVDGGVTSASYDALGRLTDLWRPGRTKGEVGADISYVYSLSPTTYSYVETKTRLADDTYASAFSIYDAMLREVETQQPAANSDADRVVTTIRYDSKGQKVREAGPYTVVGTKPSGTYYAPVLAQVLDNHRFTYDGAGRLRADVYQPKEDPAAGWKTTTSYDSDRTMVNPPAGGTPTTETYDIRGNTIRMDRHLGATTATTTVRTMRYTYDLAGRMTGMTDHKGNVWGWTYDLRGNQIAIDDPDKGAAQISYDNDDEPIKSVDARGRSLFTTYDELGRRVGLYDGTSADPTKIRAAWEYDTVSPGRLTSSTRWATPGDDSTRFVSKVDGYNAQGLPTGTTTIVPSTGITAGLGGSYSSTMSYNSVGAVTAKTFPSAEGLPNETVRYYYDRLGRPAQVGGATSIVIGATYSPYGELLQTTSGTSSGRFTYQTWFYNEGTRRLDRSLISNQASSTISDIAYGYEDAGNLVRASDTAGTKDIQCFDYNTLGEMTEAWTISTGACGTPSQSLMSTTPGAYWSSYTYDGVGNRRTEVKHVKSGSNDTTVTYGYPASGANAAAPGGSTAAGGPHAVTSISTAVGTGTAKTATYGYDESGNMTARDGHSLTWDSEGNLTKTVKGSSTIANVYDADGNRLVRQDGSTTTLYLDSTEIRLTSPADGPQTKVGQRWYTFNGKVVATRTGSSIQMLASDYHNTGMVQIDPWTGNYIKRRFDPFGQARAGAGTVASWAGDRGFLDKSTDANGLTQIGARYYDAAMGRFISVDPLLLVDDPTQTNPYTYGANNPMTRSDPAGTGLAPCECGKTSRGDRDKASSSSGKSNGQGKSGVPTVSKGDVRYVNPLLNLPRNLKDQSPYEPTNLIGSFLAWQQLEALNFRNRLQLGLKLSSDRALAKRGREILRDEGFRSRSSRAISEIGGAISDSSRIARSLSVFGLVVSSGFTFQDEYTAERNRALSMPQKIGAAAIKTGGVGIGAFAGGVFGLGSVGLVVAFVPGVNVAAATAVLVIAGGAAGGAVGGSVADTVNHVAFDN